MKRVAIIPARFASSRFPGKPLAAILGKPMVLHVAERAAQTGLFSHVIVATDHSEIFQVVKNSQVAQALMTGGHHLNGSSRCLEAYELAHIQADYIVNIQGDEPLIHASQLNDLCAKMDQVYQKDCVCTLKKKIDDVDLIFQPNVVKVVCGIDDRALYFSRSAIPFQRDVKPEQWLQKSTYYKHIGLYAFSPRVLKQIMALPPSTLETAEQLEQLRWLEHNITIYAPTTAHESHGVDTPADLEKVTRLMLGHKI